MSEKAQGRVSQAGAWWEVNRKYVLVGNGLGKEDQEIGDERREIQELSHRG